MLTRVSESINTSLKSLGAGFLSSDRIFSHWRPKVGGKSKSQHMGRSRLPDLPESSRTPKIRIFRFFKPLLIWDAGALYPW